MDILRQFLDTFNGYGCVLQIYLVLNAKMQSIEKHHLFMMFKRVYL